MNAPAESPEVLIVVPPLLVAVIEQLVERMAKTTGEKPSDVRRAVEQSVLARGCRAVQEELTAIEAQAERMGWER